jgi:hypothetical protein
MIPSHARQHNTSTAKPLRRCPRVRAKQQNHQFDSPRGAEVEHVEWPAAVAVHPLPRLRQRLTVVATQRRHRRRINMLHELDTGQDRTPLLRAPSEPRRRLFLTHLGLLVEDRVIGLVQAGEVIPTEGHLLGPVHALQRRLHLPPLRPERGHRLRPPRTQQSHLDTSIGKKKTLSGHATLGARQVYTDWCGGSSAPHRAHRPQERPHHALPCRDAAVRPPAPTAVPAPIAAVLHLIPHLRTCSSAEFPPSG